MAQNDPVKKQRSVFTTANKYQEKMILLAFFPTALIFLSFIFIVFICNPFLFKGILHHAFPGMRELVNQFSDGFVFVLCSIFILSMVLAFVITHNMVGAFGRINRELDEIIAGRSQKIITYRPNDTLTKELLERVNVLVEFYVGHKHEDTNS